MNARRFIEGDVFEVDGIEFWIQRGEKGPGDLRLMMLTPTGWRPIRMTLGFFLADFFYENEEVLYPPEQGYAGGGYYLERCREAAEAGWRSAQVRLNGERQRSAERGSARPTA